MADERPQRVIAAEIGKSKDFVSSIKNGRHFKTAANPFLGLMR